MKARGAWQVPAGWVPSESVTEPEGEGTIRNLMGEDAGASEHPPNLRRH